MTRVVHGVEDAEHVHAFFTAHVRRNAPPSSAVAVAEQVLAAQRHRHSEVFGIDAQLAQAVDPRVFAEKRRIPETQKVTPSTPARKP